ncbi:type IX secretion system ring protein PorN/GldN [Porphyromonas loveana]|uniref:type IX secretion system ring protein PorN/GldN n=1 Tax=Porphyromonas loveana TaxID=1884669 RepID=UPI0035A06CBA
MKISHVIIGTILSATAVLASDAQENVTNRSPQVGRAPRNAETQQTTSLSTRAQEYNRRLTQNTDNAPWKRVVYRRVDLMEDSNAVLYYPPRPVGDRQNLFSTIFGLLNRNMLDAYEYLDGYESFTDQYKIKFQEFLDRFGIYYQPSTNKNVELFRVADSDVPSAEVRAYYVKEEWYFTPTNSDVDVKIQAICPIMTGRDEIGEERNQPLFWIPYENIRPYIARARVMLSDRNNTRSSTVDDFFRLNLYKGDIVKTENLLNRALAEYCPTPDSMKMESKRIDKELHGFRDGLYVMQDSSWMQQTVDKKTAKARERSSGRNITSRTRGQKEDSTQPAVAPKEQKSSKATRTATRSVRRRK